MGKLIDRTGQRYGMLVIVGKNDELSGKNIYWDYICACGASGATTTTRLTSGQKSCGCHTHEMIVERNTTHGHAKKSGSSPTYSSYRAMIARCKYPSQDQYKYYGGRGISVCGRWLNGDGLKSGYECFLADMGPRPDGMTIDRLDVDGNYEPGNCRWSSQQEQMLNTRASKFTMADRRRVVSLHRTGLSDVSVSREMGMSRRYVRQIIQHNAA